MFARVTAYFLLNISFWTSQVSAQELPKAPPQDLYLQTALQAAKDQQAAKNQSLSLGAWIERRGRHVYVRDFYANSPAQVAGLKRGDQIIAVDGRDDQVMNRLIQLPHGKPIVVEYKRLPWSQPAKIKILPKMESLQEAWLTSTRESVEWFPLGSERDAAGYMRVWGASDQTLVAVTKETYASVLRKQPKMVIVDLRGPQPYDRSDLCDTLKDAFTAKAQAMVVIIDRNSGLCRLETAMHLRKTQKAKIVGEPSPLQPDIVVNDQLIFAAGNDTLLRAALTASNAGGPAAKD